MSFTERAGLFPVLLLTGCASPSIITGPPSGSVVDSMLSRSAADISAMQYRVHQSSPSAQRPGASKAIEPAKPLLPKNLISTFRSVTPNATKVPTVLTGAGPADGFIRQGGAAPTLRAALRKIIPPGKTVVFDKAISADAPELWQWAGNDRWPFILDKLLVKRGMKATLNEKSNMVTIEPAQLAQATHLSGKGISSPVPTAAPVKLSPAGVSNKTLTGMSVKKMASSGSGRNPFRGDSVPKATVSANVLVSSTATRVPIVPIIPPQVVQVRHWRIETGSTVKDWLYSQAANEACTVPGIKSWTVAWLTPTNYRVDAPLTFDGSFREMLNRLFTLYGTAKVPLYAGVRPVQCVVSVDDKEVQ
ncbi:TcpQ domain-containing protein [Pantoea agglomerans]|uniref:TcpQ domain-containing protein n=1 Tax=Enterobacter agglomerans TaxID=549 RepID=UPI003D23AA0B